MSSTAGRIDSIEPAAVRIVDATTLLRTIHQDPRGLLVETLRHDDATVGGDRFTMSYTSVTVPGQMRDRDRWHVHRFQEDRFVVPLGEMILALFDARPDSRTSGLLEVVRMAGASVHSPGSPEGSRSMTTHLVLIPKGVYHCIGNLHASEPFVLQNYPTRLYDPSDEGRVPFVDQPIAQLGGRPFAWDLVDVRRP